MRRISARPFKHYPAPLHAARNLKSAHLQVIENRTPAFRASLVELYKAKHFSALMGNDLIVKLGNDNPSFRGKKNSLGSRNVQQPVKIKSHSGSPGSQHLKEFPAVHKGKFYHEVLT